jgi:hypothetical protein
VEYAEELEEYFRPLLSQILCEYHIELDEVDERIQEDRYLLFRDFLEYANQMIHHAFVDVGDVDVLLIGAYEREPIDLRRE